MSRSFPRLLIAVVAIGLLTVGGRADVTSDPKILSVNPGSFFKVPLTLHATGGELIAGINGQMQYDPAFFQSLGVRQEVAASGFIVLSNETSPGKVRFVVYADPTALLGLDAPVIDFAFLANQTLPSNGQSSITFLNGPVAPGDPDSNGQSAASTPAGASIGNVSFSSFQVMMNKSAVRDWLLYQ